MKNLHTTSWKTEEGKSQLETGTSCCPAATSLARALGPPDQSFEARVFLGGNSTHSCSLLPPFGVSSACTASASSIVALFFLLAFSSLVSVSIKRPSIAVTLLCCSSCRDPESVSVMVRLIVDPAEVAGLVIDAPSLDEDMVPPNVEPRPNTEGGLPCASATSA